jgi:type I restriction enzyme M protein
MASSIRTETETVIKKILPYLRRRGYDIEIDLDFETGVHTPERYTKGYVDILVWQINC